MGNKPSFEERIEAAKRGINEEHPIKVKYPAFLYNEQALLKHDQTTATVLQHISTVTTKLVTFIGAPAAAGSAFTAMISLIHNSPSTIEKALMMLKVEQMIAKSAHSFIKAELESIERQLQLSISGQQREIHLAIADDSCYKLLQKFADNNFYLQRDPLAYAPFLTAFVAIYIPVIQANYNLSQTVERREDVLRNLNTLKKIIKNFQKLTSEKRTDMIFMKAVIGGEGACIIYDSLTDAKIFHEPAYSFTEPIIGEIKEWYQNETRKKYEEYFVPSLTAVTTALSEI